MERRAVVLLSDAGIAELLSTSRTIVIVGLSADPARPSHGVAEYLQQHGYRIIPVNPKYAGTHILGEHCYPTLTQAAQLLHQEDISIDIVDCFRRSDAIEPLVQEAAAAGARCLWMQQGIVNEAAAAHAAEAGLEVVMDRCIRAAHRMLR